MRKLQAVTFLMRSRPFKMLAKNTSDKRARRIARLVTERGDDSGFWMMQADEWRGDLIQMKGFPRQWPLILQHAVYMQGRSLCHLLLRPESNYAQARYTAARFKNYKKVPTAQCMDPLYVPEPSV